MYIQFKTKKSIEARTDLFLHFTIIKSSLLHSTGRSNSISKCYSYCYINDIEKCYSCKMTLEEVFFFCIYLQSINVTVINSYVCVILH